MNKRPITVTITSIAAALLGLHEILFGMMFSSSKLLLQSMKLFDLPEIIYELTGFGIIAIMTLYLIFGIVHLVVAYGLWILKKWAGILGIVSFVGISLFTFVITLYFPSFERWVPDIWGYGIVCILFIISWNSLE